MAGAFPTSLSAEQDARAAGLSYLSDDRPGIRRVRRGASFGYVDSHGRAVRDKATLTRIRKIAIPPAWQGVWISPAANGHIQATGRDQKGRKQYRYHADFRAVRDGAKYDRIFAFAAALRKIRRQVSRDMARRGLPREKVVATVVHLLDTTLIRVGNAEYARQNGSFGLTTLRDRHVRVEGGAIRFAFSGKSGKTWQLRISDRRVAKIVKSCQELPGQHLFQYLDETGARQSIGSADVNDYLRDVTGMEVTAKDFRTWAGTVLAAMALGAYAEFDSLATAKANVREAIESVAARLGNTPTICRKCYIHPEIVESYLGGSLLLQIRNAVDSELRSRLSDLKPEEAAVLAFLRARLKRTTAKNGGLKKAA